MSNIEKQVKSSNCLGVLLVPFVALVLGLQSATALPLTIAWDAGQNWPSGTTVELEANGVTADGITATEHILDVPVLPGEVISVRARAIPPAGHECGDPLALCPPSDWDTLVQTLPAVPAGLWGRIEPSGGGVMAAPTNIFNGQTTYNSGGDISKTINVTVQTGDVLIVVGQAEGYNAATPVAITVSGGGLTWTSLQTVAVNDFGYVILYHATATSNATFDITLTATNAASGYTIYWGGSVKIFRGSDGVGNSVKTNVSSGAPTVNITTTQANSSISVFDNDWNSVDGASRTWRTGAGSFTETTYFRDPARYTVYSGYHADAGAIGTQTVGLSAPSGQKYSIVAVEVKGTAGGAATVSPNDMQHAQSMDAATLLQAHILAVSELLHSQALDNATITQAFTLTPSDAINTQAIDPTTLLQQSFISPSELLQINSMDATTLLQAHTLAITDLLHSQSIDNATITQASTLTPNDALNAQALDATTLLQQSVISPADLLQGNALDATTLIQAHTLAIADITHAQTLDNVSLVVAGDISPDEMMTLQAMDAPLLLQAHIISPNDALNAQSIDSPVIVQSNVLIPAGMDHAVILDSPVIVQANVISPSELLTAQAVDNVTLAVLGSLSVDDLLSSQAIESPGLTQAHTIAPDELTHVNSIDASELFQGFILVPADLLHEQEMEGALLDVIFGLSPADLLNAQGIESPGLIQAHVIFPADLLQANRFDVAGISSGLLQVPTGRAIVLGASDRYVLLTPADRFILLTKSTRAVS
ncbi:MAG: hypothetical protein IPK63_19150 [Candidatus Competibacteraceae bacterium]|nr:hypothetical protein [Candidatus Competibacteraceae bacterium]